MCEWRALCVGPYKRERAERTLAARSSGSFVGAVEGGHRGDLFMYRTFFDLEVRAVGWCCSPPRARVFFDASRWRRRADQDGQRADALPGPQPAGREVRVHDAQGGARTHACAEQFAPTLRQSLKRAAPCARCRGGSRHASATMAGTTPRHGALARGWRHNRHLSELHPALPSAQVAYHTFIGHKVDHGKVTAGASCCRSVRRGSQR